MCHLKQISFVCPYMSLCSSHIYAPIIYQDCCLPTPLCLSSWTGTECDASFAPTKSSVIASSEKSNDNKDGRSGSENGTKLQDTDNDFSLTCFSSRKRSRNWTNQQNMGSDSFLDCASTKKWSRNRTKQQNMGSVSVMDCVSTKKCQVRKSMNI